MVVELLGRVFVLLCVVSLKASHLKAPQHNIRRRAPPCFGRAPQRHLEFANAAKV